MSFLRKKSDHQWVGESLSAYIDGELAGRERARVEQHLKECQTCAENLRTLRQTVALLKELPVIPAPRSFAVRPTVVRPRPAPAPSAWGYGLLKGATAIAALLLVLLIGGDVALHVFGGPLVSWAPAALAPEVALAPSYEPEMAPAPMEEAPMLGQAKETEELQATPSENAQEVAPTAPTEPAAAYEVAEETATLPLGAGGDQPAGTPAAEGTPEPPSGAGAVEGSETPTPVPAEPAPIPTTGEVMVPTSSAPPPAATPAEEGEQRAVVPAPEETPQMLAMADESEGEVSGQTPSRPAGEAAPLSPLRLAEFMALGLLAVLVPATAVSAWWRRRTR
ncbi:MAG TPA: zf-HC2 domain-containing protein [Anaerolineae bacterium]|nr:zf-HC2 domain-containing protein [Anaerolineae bacterium]